MDSRTILGLVMVVCLASVAVPARGVTYYVDAARPDDSGDGLSWATAKKTIQAGIDTGFGTRGVWVKAGVYKEHRTADPSGAVVLRTGVSLYGGFAGTETLLSQRNATANLTVIDARTSATYCASHAVLMDTIYAARIDGFRITNGGMLSAGHSGGAILCIGGGNTNTIANCVLEWNHGGVAGGGICCVDGSSPAITSCTLTRCVGYVGGGIAAMQGSSPQVSDCIIDRCDGEAGGAVACLDDCSAVFTNCLITSHTASLGGACYAENSSPAFQNCTISHVEAPAVYCHSSAHPLFRNTLFHDIDGYIAYEGATDSDPAFASCLFFPINSHFYFDENATRYTDVANAMMYGAMAAGNYDGDPRFVSGSYVPGNGSAAIDRGTASGAPARDLRGYLRLFDGAVEIGAYEAADEAYLAAPDTVPPISRVFGLAPSISTTVFSVPYLAADAQSGMQYVRLYYRRNGGPWIPYVGNFAASPISFNSGFTGGDGTYQFYTVARDQAGNMELAPSVADAQTVVFQSERVYVNVAATGTGTGESWTNACTSIGEGLEMAYSIPVFEIWVAGGTYHESVDLMSLVALYGGFDGTETMLSQRDPLNNETIIDGSTAYGGGPVPYVVIMEGLADARLDGFTVTGGFERGIFCLDLDDSSSIANCVIRDNGGGIRCWMSSPAITNCIVAKNFSDEDGGGLWLSRSSSPIDNCVIAGCSAMNGGGVSCSESGCVFSNCQITSNTAVDEGGAVLISDCSPTVRNCTIADNECDYGAGGISIRNQSDPVIVNSIFARNEAESIYAADSCDPVTSNCLFHDNGIPYADPSSFSVEANPLFMMDTCDGTPYRLFECNPAWPETTATVMIGDVPTTVCVCGCNPETTEPVHVTTSILLVDDPLTTNCLVGKLLALNHSPTSPSPRLQYGVLFNTEHAICLDGVVEDETFTSGVYSLLHSYQVTGCAPEPGATTTTLLVSDALTTNCLKHRFIAVSGLTSSTRESRYMVLGNTADEICVDGTFDDSALWTGVYRVVDFHLHNGSPAIDAGNVSASPAIDMDGDARPGSDGTVDIGADETEPSYSPLAGQPSPASKAYGVPRLQTGYAMSSFNVPFVTYGAESAVLYVHLFYRENGGAWSQYGDIFTASPIRFDFPASTSTVAFDFYTVAVDTEMNVEAAPVDPDVTTLVQRGDASPVRWYVDGDATGDRSGGTWENAFTTIEQAVTESRGYGLCEIWVAEGTYHEGIVLRSDMRLYGGFAGTETDLSQRDLASHETAINGGGVPHVVTIAGTNTILDGFSITGGRAYGGVASDTNGAGIFCSRSESDVTVSNCTITDCMAAGSGGGVYSLAVNASFTSCTVSNCSATTGGACAGLASLDNCVFTANTAFGGGAGLSVNGGTVTNCTIAYNNSFGYGGGVLFADCISATMTNCVIAANAATTGSACYSLRSSPQIINCTIADNFSPGTGAVSCASTPSPTLTNTIIARNSDYGIGIEVDDLFPSVRNCLFHGNTADFVWVPLDVVASVEEINLFFGGAANNRVGDPLFTADYHLGDQSAAIDRGTVCGAPATDADGQPRPGADMMVDIGAYEAPDGYLPPWDGHAPVSRVVYPQPITFTSGFNVPWSASDTESGVEYIVLFYSRNGGPYARYPDDEARHSVWPVWFDTAMTGGDGRYTFYSVAVDNSGNVETSPVIPSAETQVLSSFTASRICMDWSAMGQETGADWANACTSFDRALEISRHYGVNEIWVAGGFYCEPLVMENNLRIYGGFAGWESLRSERDLDANPTWLEPLEYGEYYAVTIDSVRNTRLDGFLISTGESLLLPPDSTGGGIYCLGADNSNVIENCAIGNNALGNIHCIDSAPVIARCALTSSSATAVYCEDSSPTLLGCTISGCFDTNGDRGGAVTCLAGSAPVLYGCIVVLNSGVTGACYSHDSDPQFLNCVVSRNSGSTAGGILCAGTSRPVLTNTIFEANTGGAVVEGAITADPAAQHCLFHGNTPYDYRDEGSTDYSGETAPGSGISRVNTIPDGQASANLSANPYFLAPISGTLSEDPQTSSTDTTVLTDWTASFVPGALKGRMVYPGTSATLQQGRYVIDNTETAIRVAGLAAQDFVSAGTQYYIPDYHMDCLSPAIDTGVCPNGSAPWWIDLDGAGRPVDIPGHGGEDWFYSFDIGPYEFQSVGELAPPASSLDYMPGKNWTCVGTSIQLNFAATDDTAVASVQLWVKSPTDTTFRLCDRQPGAAGTFAWTADAGDGRYEFACRAIDAFCNAQPCPNTAQITMLVNTEPNSAFVWTVSSATQDCYFPMTDAQDVAIHVTGAVPGGTITVSRISPAVLPSYFRVPAQMVKEKLAVTGAGLGAFTATVEWPFDPANATGVSPVDRAFAFDGGAGPSATFTATRVGNTVTVDGIHAFSDWYIGNSVGVPVEMTGFSIE